VLPCQRRQWRWTSETGSAGHSSPASTRDLLTALATISERGAGFRSLSDRVPHGRLMLTVLGDLAEFERSLILTRAREKGRGVSVSGESLS
jgi:DNA invertase Pin-like site-specific DNA recombinase